MVNLVPFPIPWLYTSTLPLCNSTIFLTTAKPSPRPPCLPSGQLAAMF